MRILWVSHFLLYPETGYGGLQRSRNLLKVLSKFHDIFLISLVREVDKLIAADLLSAKKDLERYCKKVYFIPHDSTVIRKTMDVFMSIVTGTPYTAYIYRSKELFRETLRALSENTIDLLHSDTIGIMEPLLSQTHAVKVLNHHDIESHKMDRRYRNEDNFIKRIFFRQEHRSIEKYEKENCGKYDLNIVVSDKDKERLGKICGGIEISVIENGVDCEYFSFHRRNASSRELIFTGALDYYPNAKAMLFFCGKIWPTLKRKYPELKLTIIGKNPPMQLQSFNNPEDGINMLGYIQDIRPHMKRAAVFICPILEGGGTRIKILDAFSQGVPVVSTRVGAEGLNVEDGKHIRLADTVPEFVDRVSELLEDERISNEMSSQARAFVEETYSYDIIGKKMATVYEKLLGENAR